MWKYLICNLLHWERATSQKLLLLLFQPAARQNHGDPVISTICVRASGGGRELTNAWVSARVLNVCVRACVFTLQRCIMSMLKDSVNMMIGGAVNYWWSEERWEACKASFPCRSDTQPCDICHSSPSGLARSLFWHHLDITQMISALNTTAFAFYLALSVLFCCCCFFFYEDQKTYRLFF